MKITLKQGKTSNDFLIVSDPLLYGCYITGQKDLCQLAIKFGWLPFCQECNEEESCNCLVEVVIEFLQSRLETSIPDPGWFWFMDEEIEIEGE